ncbi:MAG TPA: hypothetical protein VGK67_34400 [Myxococcales bacterium]|jgi:hypothetical protein
MLPLALTALLISVAGGGGASPEPHSVAWDGKATRPYADATARIRFAAPAAGHLVTAHHFPDARAGQLTDSFVVTVAGNLALSVDLFANPGRLSLSDYVTTHLRFLKTPATATAEGQAGKAQVRAILLDQPRTGQAFGQRLAVFALSDARIVRISCPDRDEPALARLFEKALESFEERAP